MCSLPKSQVSLKSRSRTIIIYNAAKNAAATPITPPKPAITTCTLFVGAAPAELELELAAVTDALPVLLELLGALVVTGPLVSVAVTLVVEAGTEEVLATAAVPDFVVLEAIDIEAEYPEQRAKPTDAAFCRST